MAARKRAEHRQTEDKRVGSLSGYRVVITGGPTREHLDDIRFLSNASTGRMGIELARAARARGAEVVLVMGPTQLAAPRGVETIPVVSTSDLLKATRQAVEGADLVIFSAAPSDFKPARRRKGKPAREGSGRTTLDLLPTQDVAATLGRRKGNRIHIGFALETAPGLERALGKIARKHLDAIVLNGPKNFGTGGGHAWWLRPDGTKDALPTAEKASLARAILTHARHLIRAGEAG